MAFTSFSPLKNRIINPIFKHISTYKHPNFIDFRAPLNSGPVCASITTESSKKDDKLRSGVEGLPVGLKEELMPKHIAFIMDGNRRWAAEKGWSSMAGHGAMRMALKPLLRQCSEFKIKAVSIYAFSTENWNRPAEEVNFLMEMFEDLLSIDAEELLSLGCRISVMGNKTDLSKTLQKLSFEIEQKSKVNLGTHVNFAINYSGKYDILQACQNISNKVRDGLILPNQIDENTYEQELDTRSNDFPSLDLVIRTSGEIRLSNFMLWQMAYSELYFVKKYFPDFGKDDLIRVLLAFQESRSHV
ncbi:hypothetical protein LXL04_036551 [Taraxacum kok-saghyz]